VVLVSVASAELMDQAAVTLVGAARGEVGLRKEERATFGGDFGAEFAAFVGLVEEPRWSVTARTSIWCSPASERT
jgi:hypothetical protein